MKGEKIIVDGINWYRYPNSNRSKSRMYYLGKVNSKPKYLHRYLYEKENGTIPKGYEIHHIDGNSLNNDLSNLQCLSKKEHSDITIKEQSVLKNCKECNKEYQALPYSLFCSKKCTNRWTSREWSRKKNGHEPREIKIRNCQECGKEYEGISPKFCSGECSRRNGGRRRNRINKGIPENKWKVL